MTDYSWVQQFWDCFELLCHEIGTSDDNCGTGRTVLIFKPMFNHYLLSIVSHYSVSLLSKTNATHVSFNVQYDL